MWILLFQMSFVVWSHCPSGIVDFINADPCNAALLAMLVRYMRTHYANSTKVRRDYEKQQVLYACS